MVELPKQFVVMDQLPKQFVTIWKLFVLTFVAIFF